MYICAAVWSPRCGSCWFDDTAYRLRTLEALHQLGGDEQQAQRGARQQAADQDGARQAEGRLGLAAQLHQGAVADAALQRVQRIQPLPPLPQRRQVCVLHNISICRD